MPLPHPHPYPCTHHSLFLLRVSGRWAPVGWDQPWGTAALWTPAVPLFSSPIHGVDIEAPGPTTVGSLGAAVPATSEGTLPADGEAENS